MQILLSERAITIYEVLFILVLIVVLVKQHKRKKDAMERRRISNVKKRNQQLEEMLKNPDIHQQGGKGPNPFDVQYMQESSSGNGKTPAFQAEIEVHTETSVQKFLLDLDQEVTIGRGEKNILPLSDQTAAERCCSIFVKKQAVYVRNLSPSEPVWIQRGKKKMEIRRQIVKMQSKDIITFGRTTLHVLLYQN